MHFPLLISLVTSFIVYINAQALDPDYCDGDSIVAQKSARQIARAERLFGLEYYKKHFRYFRTSGCLSIANIFIGMSMLCYGAKGSTEEKLRTALKLEYPCNFTQCGFHDMMDKINRLEIDTDKFDFANNIFYDDVSPLKREFENHMNMMFLSKPRSLDISDRPNVKNIITDWFVNQTDILRGDKIIIPEEFSMSGSSLFLVGTSNLRMPKLNNFYKCKDKSFFHGYVNSTRQFIRTFDDFNYGELVRIDAKFLQIPLRNDGSDDTVSMFIVLPGNPRGLKNLEQNMTLETLHYIFNEGRSERVRVDLPEISIYSANKLLFNDFFSLRNVPSERTDFSGITDNLIGRTSKGLNIVNLRISGSRFSDCPPDEDSTKYKTFNAKHSFMIIVNIEGKNPIVQFMGRYTGFGS